MCGSDMRVIVVHRNHRVSPRLSVRRICSRRTVFAVVIIAIKENRAQIERLTKL